MRGVGEAWACGEDACIWHSCTAGIACLRTASYVATDPALCHSRIKHILQYLFGTFTLGMIYTPVVGKARTQLWSFADASFSPQGARSHEGTLILHGSSPSAPSEQPELAGNLIAWRSGRQTFVTLSTAESELVALSNGVETTIPLALTLSEISRLPLTSTTVATTVQQSQWSRRVWRAVSGHVTSVCVLYGYTNCCKDHCDSCMRPLTLC